MALTYRETLEHDYDPIMVMIQLHSTRELVTINAMIDSGAMEDFIDKEVCNKHGIKMTKAKKPKGDLPHTWKTKWYGPCYPYDESTDRY